MPHNPLQSVHDQAEATMLAFGPDISLVESFGEVEAEYAALRKSVALMDAPHRAVAILTGRDRLSFLQNLVTNDAKALAPGQGCYAYMLNTRGRIVADMNILHGEDSTMLDMDARLIADFCGQLEKFVFAEDVKIRNAADELARLTLAGPNAAAVLRKITDARLELPTAPLSHVRRTAGRTPLTIFRNDQCGEVQYELIAPCGELVNLWHILHEAGNGHGEPQDTGLNLRAIGWSAFNVARIEAGTPLYGIDITDNYLPMETGPWYPRAVSVKKGCYLGQEIVARMHAHNAVARLLVGLKVSGDLLPVAASAVVHNNSQIGIVTSSCMSPMLGYAPVALGYVRRQDSSIGSELHVNAGGQTVKALVCALPFWQKVATRPPDAGA